MNLEKLENIPDEGVFVALWRSEEGELWCANMLSEDGIVYIWEDEQGWRNRESYEVIPKRAKVEYYK